MKRNNGTAISQVVLLEPGAKLFLLTDYFILYDLKFKHGPPPLRNMKEVEIYLIWDEVIRAPITNFKLTTNIYCDIRSELNIDISRQWTGIDCKYADINDFLYKNHAGINGGHLQWELIKSAYGWDEA